MSLLVDNALTVTNHMGAQMELNSKERRELWAKLYKEARAKLIVNPSLKKLSGQQIAYAKGQATKQFFALGL